LIDFSISPSSSLRILVFKSETRESPGLVTLYEGQTITKILEKELDKAQDAKVLWNSRGNAAVIWCSSSVDSSGRNYYGEHALKYLCGPKIKHIKTPEGPVHDLAWSPKGDEFIVISGFMPPHSQLFNLDGVKVQDITNTHRNTVKWNPFGTLFLIGGFGNLQGDLEVWERESMRIVGSVRSELAVTLEWTPCGRMFVTATVNPRMRVDNGFKVYKYTGEILYAFTAEGELWEVKCRPAIGKFQSRPLSATATPRAAPVQKKAYRAPGSSSSFAERFRAMKTGAPDVPEKTKQETEDFIPGYVPDKKKRKKKKKEPVAANPT
jgi:translation initiation factor 2A